VIGEYEGTTVGSRAVKVVGSSDGSIKSPVTDVGSSEVDVILGASVGVSVGTLVGDSVGASVGTLVGDSVGASVGTLVVGESVGASVGTLVGDSVGKAVGIYPMTLQQ